MFNRRKFMALVSAIPLVGRFAGAEPPSIGFVKYDRMMFRTGGLTLSDDEELIYIHPFRIFLQGRWIVTYSTICIHAPIPTGHLTCEGHRVFVYVDVDKSGNMKFDWCQFPETLFVPVDVVTRVFLGVVSISGKPYSGA